MPIGPPINKFSELVGSNDRSRTAPALRRSRPGSDKLLTRGRMSKLSSTGQIRMDPPVQEWIIHPGQECDSRVGAVLACNL